MRRVAAALLATISVVPGHAAAAPTTRIETPLGAEPLTAAAFRERLASALSQRRPSARIERVGDMSLRLSEAGQTEIQVNIDNAYARYRADPGTLVEIVDHFAGLANMPGEEDAKVEQLVIVLRPSDYVVTNTAVGADLSQFVEPKPMAGDVSFFLAVDSPQIIRTATVADLVRWKLDLPAAWARAAANIRLRMGPLAMARLEGEPVGSSVMTAESGLAPSLLATASGCDSENTDGIAGQVVLLYSKDAYLFGVPSDPGSMANFWLTAKRVIAARESISLTPLTCSGGRWARAAIP